MEAAEKDSKRLSNNVLKSPPTDTPHFSVVNKVDQHKSVRPARPEHSGDCGCYRCGGKHNQAQCTFKSYECHYCKKGHLAKVCWKKSKDQNKPERANMISTVGDDAE